MKSGSPGRWITVWNRLRRVLTAVVATRVWMGMAILALAALIYLEPYFTSTLLCSGDIVHASVAGRPAEWQCFKDVLRDLRKDGAAAGVILGIAAAALASAWSSGGSGAAE